MELLIKDFRAFVFARGRQFLEDFIDFISGPKTFLATATVYTAENLARAFSFFVIVNVLSTLLGIFLFPKEVGGDKLAVFSVVFTIVFFGFSLLTLQVSWLAVGARPPLRRMLLAFLYFLAIAGIIQMLLGAAGVMIAYPMPRTLEAVNHLNDLLTRDPLAANRFIDANPGLLVKMVALVGALIGYLLLQLAWTIVVWGAFRALAGSGRIRSALALAVFFVLSVLLFILSVYFVRAAAPDLALVQPYAS